MIVNWKKQRINVLPEIGHGKHFLIPGYNEISNEAWVEYKPLLKYHLDSGDLELVVEEQKIEQEKDGKKVTKKVDVAVLFKDMSLDKKREVIENTNDIKVLKKWRKDVPEDAEIRAEISDKIKEIEDFISYDPTKKDKK